MFNPKMSADKKKSVRVWQIQTNCREQSLVRPITDQIQDGGRCHRRGKLSFPKILMVLHGLW